MSVSQDPERPGRTPGPVDDGRGLWTAGRRNLTVGLVLTVTLVAFEALAVSTVMPIVARELGDLELYGWVFTSFMLGSLIGIVVVGGLIDRRGLGGPFAVGIGLFAIGLIVGGLAPSMDVLVGGALPPGARRRNGAARSPTSRSAAACRSDSGRRCSRRSRRRGSCPASSARPSPASSARPSAGAGCSSACSRSSRSRPGIAYPPVRRVGPGAPSAAAATLRERLPLALVVAAGTGLLLGGLTSGEPRCWSCWARSGPSMAILALRRLTPPGTLRAARGLPAAVLMRGILTFAFFAVDAYVALALVEWRGLTAIAAGISLTAATLTWTTGSWIQARLSSRYPPERFVRAGIAVLIVGLTPFLVVLYPAVLAVAGDPDVRPRRPRHGPRLLAARPHRPARGARRRAGPASSALSLTDSLGTALGTGVTGAAVAASVRDAGTPFRGLLVGFAVAIAVARWA